MTNIWTDGGCRYNPGLMAIGYVLEWSDNERIVYGERLDNGTNNQAELYAIRDAIAEAYDLGCELPYTLHTDSALAYRLATGEASAHVPELVELTREITDWTSFIEIEFIRIPREENERADRLVKEVLYD